jgi:serine/threonine protein kinase
VTDLDFSPDTKLTVPAESAHSTDVQPKTGDPLLGTILGGHLKILSCLGAGGMSVVYKAEDLLLHRIVAVKLLHSHSALNPQNVLRFRQEAMAASKIDHPNVIRVYEFNVPDEGQPYLVMDFIEGQSLAEFMRTNGPIEMRRAITLMGIICDGLQCAHDAGVVHRDLKPGNIMLLKDSSGKQTLKIVDFGIAKVLTEDAQGHDLTQTGEVFGSPLYMSPEQCYGKTLDRRSDIYSLGCVMFEICTGQPPIKGGSMLETIQMQTTEMPAPSASFYLGIKYGAQFDAVIAKALAKDPSERHQSATDFKQAINSLPSASPPSHEQKMVSSSTKKIAMVIICAALLTVISSMIFPSIQIFRQPSQPLTQPPVQPPSQPPFQAPTQAPSQALSSPVSRQPSRRSTVMATSSNRVKSLFQQPDSSSIQVLRLEDGEIRDDTLSLLSGNKRLHDLLLIDTGITDRSGTSIRSLTQLQKLEIRTASIGDAFLKSISGLPNLSYLWCYQTDITDSGATYFQNFPKLKQLGLSETQIGDFGLEKISALNLEELRLSNTRITPAGLKFLEKMPSLKILLVGRNSIGDAGARAVSKLTKLEHLSLESTNLTNEGLKEILSLKNLTNLDLHGNNQLSNSSLDILNQLPNLRSLHIGKCGISKSALNKFRESHPGLKCFS